MSTLSDVSNSFSPPLSGRNFQVIHLRNPSLTINASESFDMLGIYPDLATAQRNAFRALEHALQECLRRGYRGRYYNDIDLQLRGMITAFVQGAENDICLSEFHIKEVYLRPDAETSAGFWNGLGDDGDALEVGNDNLAHSESRVFLESSCAIQPLRFNETFFHRILFAESCWASECRAEWSQTRIPLCSRREDRPFRTQDDSPYEQMLSRGFLASRR